MNAITPLLLGVPALIGFGMFTSWQAAVCLFFVLYANNLSQKTVRKNETKDSR